MSEIKRYDHDVENSVYGPSSVMREFSDGAYVKFDDHSSELRRLAGERDEARTRLDEANAQIHQQAKTIASQRSERDALRREVEDLTKDRDAAIEGLQRLDDLLSFGPALFANIGESGRNEIRIRCEYAREVIQSLEEIKRIDALDALTERKAT